MRKSIEVTLSDQSAELFNAIKERMGGKVARAVISCLVEAGARKTMRDEVT